MVGETVRAPAPTAHPDGAHAEASLVATRLGEELERLVPVALHGLSQMQDQRTGLFSHKALLGTDGQITNRGVNPLYTAATIVGLLSGGHDRSEPYGSMVRHALDALLRRTNEGDPAVLATVLWGCELAGRSEAARLTETLIAATEPRRASSMQLGLALVGLAAAMGRGDRHTRQVADAARALSTELCRRYIPAAHVFVSTGHRRGVDPGRHLMTSFASQVYPVLGLCELAEASGSDPPAAVAEVCDFLVRSQGELGQWWWFYSTRTPKVIEGYPVYSVHQDAMAVMALLTAARLGVGDYLAPLALGLNWIGGQNELGVSFIDRRVGLIYRALQRRRGNADGFAGWSRQQRCAAYLAALADRPRPAPVELEQLAECRSYHLGWLLLAAAMARGAA
jgi:hypothetical protein